MKAIYLKGRAGMRHHDPRSGIAPEESVEKIKRALRDETYLEETFLNTYIVAASKSLDDSGKKDVVVYHEGVRAVLRAVLEA